MSDMKTEKNSTDDNNIDNYVDEEEEPSVNCYCSGQCSSGMEFGTCQTKPGGRCFTAVEVDLDDDGIEYPIITFGCLPPHEMALFQCRSTLHFVPGSTSIKCCNKFDYCNKPLLPPIKYIHPTSDLGQNGIFLVTMAPICISLVIVLAVLLLVFFKQKNRTRTDVNQIENGTTINIANYDNVLNLNFSPRYTDLLEKEQSMSASFASSGSYSNATFAGAMQSTISQQIHMVKLIGKGKYSEVWMGKWRAEKVAVRVFHIAEEEYWLRETRIYQTVLMRHENILRFIAADIKENETTKMLLITDYHEKGTLSNFLKSNTVTFQTFVKMAKDIVSGLNHLHTEVNTRTFIRPKPSIAHGNLTSDSILVKKNGECCIGNLGMAVQLTLENKIDVPVKYPVKHRYTAPEFLEEDFDRSNFNCYLMADVYSFSLILWEILNRTTFDDNEDNSVAPYKMPFEDELPLSNENEPHFIDKLIEQISKNRLRPTILQTWENNEICRVICAIMKECWSSTPNVRLTVLRVKKSIMRLDMAAD